MVVTALDHLVLTVRDLDATCAFYASALGMRVVAFDGRRALAFGAQKINLHEAGREIEPKATTPLPGSADLCFLIDEPVRAAAARLDRLGIPIELGPVPRVGATGPITSLYLRDPDGNLIELSRPDGDRG